MEKENPITSEMTGNKTLSTGQKIGLWILGIFFLLLFSLGSIESTPQLPDPDDYSYKVTWLDGNNPSGIFTNEIEVLEDGKIWTRGIHMNSTFPFKDTLDVTLSGTFQIHNLNTDVKDRK